jgi:Fic family protein
MWREMREVVLTHFPQPPSRPINANTYLKRVEETYVTDAYHSLSIEGYRVSQDLIQRVKSGTWNPGNSENDREHVAALAARGYWQAFKEVEKSLRKVLKGINPGKVFDEDHREWYREMFAPCVTAGIVKPADLAGYRRGQVYIRRSMHVPPNPDAVRDLMPAFCDLLSKEKEAAVRVVLGHFFFVYIHPYMDGNGRIGRFLMNVMLAAGGYPWIVVPVEQRNKYMAALEEASVRQNIMPFSKFLAGLVTDRLKGKELPQIK